MCYSGLCPKEDNMGNCIKDYNNFPHCPIAVVIIENILEKTYTVTTKCCGEWSSEFNKNFDDRQEAIDYENALKTMFKLIE